MFQVEAVIYSVFAMKSGLTLNLFSRYFYVNVSKHRLYISVEMNFITRRRKKTLYNMNNNDMKLRVAYVFGLNKILIL